MKKHIKYRCVNLGYIQNAFVSLVILILITMLCVLIKELADIHETDQNIRRLAEDINTQYSKYWGEYETSLQPKLVNVQQNAEIPKLIENEPDLIDSFDNQSLNKAEKEVPSWYPCKVTDRPEMNPSFWIMDNPHNYSYLINNLDLCQEKSITVLFVIISSPDHYKERQLARSTWLSVRRFRGINMEHVFLLGYKDEEEQKTIEAESERRQDIIQEDFIDSYRNLTLKSVMGLKWATEFCKNAKWIFKLDDDTLVNTFLFVDYFLKLKPSSSEHIQCGSIHTDADSLIPIRSPDRKGYRKWILTKEEYPDDCFPVYCSGGGYGMSQQVASLLYQKSLKTRLLPIEDLYITGILPALTLEHIKKQWVFDFGLYWDYFNGGNPQVWVYILIAFHDIRREANRDKWYLETWSNLLNKTSKILVS